MLNRGLEELTGAPDAVQAWQRFFKKGERVGIKVKDVKGETVRVRVCKRDGCGQEVDK